jgi:hypothetical protein
MSLPALPYLVQKFKEADRLTSGTIRGVPFVLQPPRSFWRDHPKCTLYEATGEPPERFDDLFDGLGSTAQLAAHEIYLVNNCRHGDHPRQPYGQ